MISVSVPLAAALSFRWAVEHRLCPEVFDWLVLQGFFCKAGHLVRKVRGWTCPAFHVFPAIPIASSTVIGLVILVVLHVSWPVLCPHGDTITSSLGRCCVLQGSVFSLALAPALTHTLPSAFPPPLQGTNCPHVPLVPYRSRGCKRSGDA